MTGESGLYPSLPSRAYGRARARACRDPLVHHDDARAPQEKPRRSGVKCGTTGPEGPLEPVPVRPTPTPAGGSRPFEIFCHGLRCSLGLVGPCSALAGGLLGTSLDHGYCDRLNPRLVAFHDSALRSGPDRSVLLIPSILAVQVLEPAGLAQW